MPCTILCAADLWGVKVNYELPFQHPPTQAELQAKIDQVFMQEHGLRRPADVPLSQGFVIERMQTFDERAQQWVDLLTPAQLSDYSQVYLFQKENEYHREVQSKIPPPVAAPAHASVQRVGSNSPTTPAVSGPRSVAVAPNGGYYARGSSPQKHVAPVAHSSPTLPNSQQQQQQYQPQGQQPQQQQQYQAQYQPPAYQSQQQQQSSYQTSSAMEAGSTPAPASSVGGANASPVQVVPEAFNPQVPASQMGRTVSMSEKQRSVFEEMDSKKTRAVDEEDLRGTFQRLRIEYSGSSISEMFGKADLNHDNVISFDEWVRYTELFPTLLDSLYFRTKV
eukprot:TRINITY_DN3325_c0_g1_i2.p1 TRINITY_DN3325_c0_g1~~TRINITY_DN3325_c0_g1_i2.p1  ORF type:complete len:335 (+),score=133.71 TRINITY_DN3325_c0_g1_i2:57-1061(+)